jgi:hypothetical protein
MNVVRRIRAALSRGHAGNLSSFFARTLVVAAGLVALASPPARAALTINIQQVGLDVVATASGTVNLSGLSLVTPNGSTSSAFLFPVGGYISMGTPGPSAVYSGFTTSGSLGSGGFTSASSTSGDLIAPDGGDNYLFLPHGYVSGTSISATTSWNNKTFAGLGLTEGSSLTLSWASDSVTVNVVTPVPEPMAAILPGFGALLVGAILRRRVTLRAQECRRRTGR